MNKQGPLNPLVLLLAFAALLIVGCSTSSDNVVASPPSVLTSAANPIEEGRRTAANEFAAALAAAGEPGSTAYEASVANAKAAYEAKMSALTPPGSTWASKTIMTETKITSEPETFVTDLKTGELIKVDENEIAATAATASSDATAALSTTAAIPAATAAIPAAPVAPTLEPQPLSKLLTETPTTAVTTPTISTPTIPAPAVTTPATSPLTTPVIAPPSLEMPSLSGIPMSTPKVTSSTITTTANPAPGAFTKSTRTVTTSTSSRGLAPDASSDAFAAPIVGSNVISVQEPKPTEVLSLSDFRYNLPPEDKTFKRVEAIPFRHSPGYIDLSQPRPQPSATRTFSTTAVQPASTAVTRTRNTNASKATGPLAVSPANQPSFRNWSSWENLTPMGGLPQTMLFVTGEVLTANSRYVPVLREAATNSGNGELLLDLELEAMNAIGNEVITYRIVRFEKEVSPGIYNTVVVRRNGTPAIRLDVRKLSR